VEGDNSHTTHQQQTLQGTMANSNSNGEAFMSNTSGTRQTPSQPQNDNTAQSYLGQNPLPHGVNRTASGRETYYPDGLRSGEEEAVPLEKVNTSSSSDSSSETRFGSNGGSRKIQRVGTSSSDDAAAAQLERRVTRSEIDDEGRRELARLFTSASQVTRQMSIANPNDPSVDPASDSFDLSKFLHMFRHQLEGEGIEMKKVAVVFKNLNVFGSGNALQLQSTVADFVLAPFRAKELFGKSQRKQILHSFDGIIRAGELCVVLGRPGSGCSTLLKALTGELAGLDTDESIIQYNGIPQNKMIKEFKGETVYNQEVDKHFPHLTVGQTLEFAAAVRTPSKRPGGASRDDFSQFMAKVVMAVLGLSHTYNTKVGNDFVRGVSGGERKRVSVAEMLLAGAPFAAWDK
jgi:ATP-binding cassette subfamily G (WHITE) protein 2 (PDR)